MIKKESFEEKMKTYCELKSIRSLGDNAVAAIIAKSFPKIKEYYDLLGE